MLEHTEESSRLCDRYQSWNWIRWIFITSESSHTLASGMLKIVKNVRRLEASIQNKAAIFVIITVAWIHCTKIHGRAGKGAIRYWMSEPLQPTFYGKCAQEYKEAPRDCGIFHVYTSFNFESDCNLIEKQRKQVSQWELKTTLVEVSIAQFFLDVHLLWKKCYIVDLKMYIYINKKLSDDRKPASDWLDQV